MEASLDVYRKTLELFSTIDEAIEYIKKKAEEGDFEICLELLEDIKAAVHEINNSLNILMARIERVSQNGGAMYIEIVYHLERLEQAYGDSHIEAIVAVVEQSVEPSLQEWRKDIIVTAGTVLSS